MYIGLIPIYVIFYIKPGSVNRLQYLLANKSMPGVITMSNIYCIEKSSTHAHGKSANSTNHNSTNILSRKFTNSTNYDNTMSDDITYTSIDI